MLMYQTKLLCPVCKEVMDTIDHPNPKPDSMGLAMLGGEGRADHRHKSPKCALDDNWCMGWIEETSTTPVEKPEYDDMIVG